MNRALLSYWVCRNADLRGAIDRLGGAETWDIFADSGAFSAYTTGATVDIDRYGEWLLHHADLLNFAAALDVIGDARATLVNLGKLQEIVGGKVTIVPAFHVGSDWSVLADLCRTHAFVAFGGAATVSTREDALMAWLVKAHRIAADRGAVVHGFAQTRPVYVENLPYYSVDSTYWRLAMIGGQFTLFDRDTHRMVPIKAGRGWLKPHERSVLRQYGQDPGEFASEGFAYIRKSPDANLARDQAARGGMLSMAAWMRYEADLRRRGRVCVAPPGVDGDGLKIYLSIGVSEMGRLVQAGRVADGVGVMEVAGVPNR